MRGFGLFVERVKFEQTDGASSTEGAECSVNWTNAACFHRINNQSDEMIQQTAVDVELIIRMEVSARNHYNWKSKEHAFGWFGLI